jgi:biopolymer transport protein ExbD
MAFQPSASKKHRSNSDGELNMNSMMDMMTIILLFLLKSYSTEGQLKTAAEDLKLPKSIRLEKPVKIPMVEVSKTVIIYDDQVILEIKDVGDRFVIPQLKSVLSSAAEDMKKVEEYGGVFDNKILLLIDEASPYELLLKVMKTCADSEFYDIRLMVLGGENDVKT